MFIILIDWLNIEQNDKIFVCDKTNFVMGYGGKKMEIIKDLPEVFEEFAEQRKNSFLAVKQVKDAGKPVIGSYCTYFPQELAMAMGAASVSL